MSISRKILLPVMVAMFAFSSISGAKAEEKEKDKTSEEGMILFRIENIKPVVDEEGLTKKCSFMVTTYNRTDKKISSAKLKFKWADNVYNMYAVDNGELKVNKGNNSVVNVETSINLNNIPPHSQKSFSGSVDTEKCFLLFDNLEYVAESCMYEGDKVEMKDSKVVSKGEGCVKNFNYINSKNPEYYSEFKDVPASVLEQQAEEEKNSDLKNINKSYNEAISKFDKLNSVIGEIR